MPTPHIGAEKGQIAPVVLLPGDPVRAQRIAETFFQDFRDHACYNHVRNMLGYTGISPGGHQVSVQGSGMGIPSLGIYTAELFDNFDVQTIIRVGTCGSFQEDINPGDIVIAQCASTDSNAVSSRFYPGDTFAAPADFGLLAGAVEAAKRRDWPVRVGNVLSTDTFYSDDDKDAWKRWARYGVIAVEMEAAMLYTLAARRQRRALAILTVSDSLVTGAHMSAEDREMCFGRMVHLALEAAFPD